MSARRRYTDQTAGMYAPRFPIVEFERARNNASGSEPEFRSRFRDSMLFPHLSASDRERAIRKLTSVCLVSNMLQELAKALSRRSSPVLHISIGGSYLFKPHRVRDIDFNVVLEGTGFAYRETRDVAALNAILPTPVEKISFMFFGEEDFKHDTPTFDTIETEDYVHTRLRMREGLVLPFRNVLVCGSRILQTKIDTRNLLVRIRRQLYHASLILDSRVDLHRSMSDRIEKSLGRISEGALYLSHTFPELCPPPVAILNRERDCGLLASERRHGFLRGWLLELEHDLRKAESASRFLISTGASM